MLCKNCSNSVSVQSKFCPTCGTKLNTNKYFIIQSVVSLLNTLEIGFLMHGMILMLAIDSIGKTFVNVFVNGTLLVFGCTDFSSNCIYNSSLFHLDTKYNFLIVGIILFLCIVSFILSILLLIKKNMKRFSMLEIIITVVFCISNICVLLFVGTASILLTIISVMFLIYFIINCWFLLENKL